MFTRRDFVESILADPDDDVRRLAFADWLEEHDDGPRAEFIRVQIELARLPADDPDRPRLAAREAELFAARGAAWAAPLPDPDPEDPVIADAPPGLPQWHRGFLHNVVFHAQDFMGLVEPVLAREPVTGVFLFIYVDPAVPGETDTAWVERLAASPRLRLVATLATVGSEFGVDQFVALVRSPHLTRVRTVDLFKDRIDLTGARALCASPAAAGLRRLVLDGAIGTEEDGETPDTLAAVEALAGCPRFAGLEQLTLHCNGLREASVRAFLASPHLSHALDLSFLEYDWEPPPELAAALAERFAPPPRAP